MRRRRRRFNPTPIHLVVRHFEDEGDANRYIELATREWGEGNIMWYYDPGLEKYVIVLIEEN